MKDLEMCSAGNVNQVGEVNKKKFFNNKITNQNSISIQKKVG